MQSHRLPAAHVVQIGHAGLAGVDQEIHRARVDVGDGHAGVRGQERAGRGDVAVDVVHVAARGEERVGVAELDHGGGVLVQVDGAGLGGRGAAHQGQAEEERERETGERIAVVVHPVSFLSLSV